MNIIIKNIIIISIIMSIIIYYYSYYYILLLLISRSKTRPEERDSFRTGITPLPRFRVGEMAARRRQLLTDRLHATSTIDTMVVPFTMLR